MNNPRRIQRHLVKALAAGALLAAAALPMAIATAAGAATPAITSVTLTPSGAGNTVGQGATGTITVTGTGFAGNGGAFTLTDTTDPTGVTFSHETETASTTSVTADYAVSATATTGEQTLTLTDSANTSALTLTNAFDVTLAPTVSAVSPALIGVTQGATPVTLTGPNFESGAKVSLVSTVDGTTLTVGAATLNADGSLTFSVTPTNSVSGAAATTGTYNIVVTNPDGGTATDSAAFTVDAMTVTEVTPSAIPNTAGTTTLTITGTGFEYGATISADTGLTFGTPTFVSPTTLTVTATIATPLGTPADENITITNPGATPPSGTPPGNGATYTLTGGLGVGEASAVAPVVTASSSTSGAAITPGAAASTLTLTGLGFSQYTTAEFTDSNGTTPATGITANDFIESGNGTSLTFVVTVGSGAVAGTDSVQALNGTAASAPFADGLYIAGPTIASASPAAIVDTAPIGTTFTITGTGFNNTMTGSVTHFNGGTLQGQVEYVSPTSATFVVNHTGDAADVNSTTAGDTITVSEIDSDGVTVVSAPFTLTVDAPPAVTSVITYSTTGTTGVGVGATAQKVVINGTGFQTGAKVSAFTNAAGAADPDVTFTVTGVNAAGTQITGTVAVAAGDTNTADGYTITNPDGGTDVVTAYEFPLTIQAAPTITAISPTTATYSSTNAFTVTGTGFSTSAVASLSSDGTCGATTVVSSTSITVSCTLGAASTTPVTLDITNPNGGTAVSGPLTTPAPPAPSFKVKNPAHGTAIAGKTSTLTISGTGFYGQPRITSTAAGTRVGVTHDTGTLLTIVVTTKAGVAGEHTFTITLANGKSAKANYAIKK